MLCKINTHFVSKQTVRASTIVDAGVPVISEDVHSDVSGGNITDAIEHREVSPVCVSPCVPYQSQRSTLTTSLITYV
jgi:hypothetical protein